MFVCICCGEWKVEQRPTGLRIKHCGFWIKDAKSIEEVEEVLARYGLTLSNLEER